MKPASAADLARVVVEWLEQHCPGYAEYAREQTTNAGVEGGKEHEER